MCDRPLLHYAYCEGMLLNIRHIVYLNRGVTPSVGSYTSSFETSDNASSRVLFKVY